MMQIKFYQIIKSFFAGFLKLLKKLLTLFFFLKLNFEHLQIGLIIFGVNDLFNS